MIYLIGGKIMAMVIKNMNDTNEENDNGFFSLLHNAINPHISSPSKTQKPSNPDEYSEKEEDGK